MIIGVGIVSGIALASHMAKREGLEESCAANRLHFDPDYDKLL